MSARTGLLAILLIGATWGLTQPLIKIAVSTGHGQFGLVFWQLVMSALLAGGICAARGRGLPLTRSALRTYLVVAALGSVLPSLATYRAAVFLPAGLLAILISTAPLMAFPLAMLMGNERFNLRRLAGLCLGFGGVLVLLSPGGTTVSGAVALMFVPVALIAPALYALEGNLLGRLGMGGADPFQAVFGAALLGMGFSLPLALGTGQFIRPWQGFGLPEGAMLLCGLINTFAYAGYVLLITRSGAVFAAQVGYLVTAFGLAWSMALLGESYAPGFWIAGALILGGIILVQPRRDALAAG